MAHISYDMRMRIIELWLKGLPRDTIASRLRISGSTVSKYTIEFKDSLSEEAAELLEGLRLLSAELKKSRKTLPEALSLAHISSKLQKLGVDSENIELFISSSKKTAKELGVEAEEYTKAAMKLARLEAETGKSYTEITKDFEEKKDQVTQLNQEIGTLTEKRIESKRELSEQLRNSMLTKKDITYASTLRDALTPYGFTIKDVSKIPKLIEHIKSCNKDPERVLARLIRIESLARATATLRQQRKTKQKELDKIEVKVAESKQQHARAHA